MSWVFQWNSFWWSIKPGEIFDFLQLGFRNRVSQSHVYGNFLPSTALTPHINQNTWETQKEACLANRILQECLKFFGFFWVFLFPLKVSALGSLPGWTGESSLHSHLESWLEKLYLDHDCTPCQNKSTQRAQVYPGSQKTICVRL